MVPFQLDLFQFDSLSSGWTDAYTGANEGTAQRLKVAAEQKEDYCLCWLEAFTEFSLRVKLDKRLSWHVCSLQQGKSCISSFPLCLRTAVHDCTVPIPALCWPWHPLGTSQTGFSSPSRQKTPHFLLGWFFWQVRSGTGLLKGTVNCCQNWWSEFGEVFGQGEEWEQGGRQATRFCCCWAVRLVPDNLCTFTLQTSEFYSNYSYFTGNLTLVRIGAALKSWSSQVVSICTHYSLRS